MEKNIFHLNFIFKLKFNLKKIIFFFFFFRLYRNLSWISSFIKRVKLLIKIYNLENKNFFIIDFYSSGTSYEATIFLLHF
jgi:hypothetical protein